jgi:hypothetical protein
VLPAEIAHAVGYEYLVADTVNHAIRAISLKTKKTGLYFQLVFWKNYKKHQLRLQINLYSKVWTNIKLLESLI